MESKRVPKPTQTKSFKISLKLEKPAENSQLKESKIILKDPSKPKRSKLRRDKLKLKRNKKNKPSKRTPSRLTKKISLRPKKATSRLLRKKIQKVKHEKKIVETSSLSICSDRVQKIWSYKWVPSLNVCEDSSEIWLRRWVRCELISG